MIPRWRSWRLATLPVVAVLIALALAIAAPAAGRVQSSRSFVWDRYDVKIEVEGSGSLLVTERFQASFSGSPAFTYGFADLPTARTEGIDVVSLSEETANASLEYEKVDPAAFTRQPGTYTVRTEAESVFIEYGFTPAANEQRTFVLTYRAHGALRVYGEGAARTEQIWWNAIGSEVTALAPVRAAAVTVVLPAAVPRDRVVLGDDTTGPAADHTRDGKVWRWEQSDLTGGEDFVVRMEFPAVTRAQVPAWQTAEECDRLGVTDRLIRHLVADIARSLGLSVEDPCEH